MKTKLLTLLAATALGITGCAAETSNDSDRDVPAEAPRVEDSPLEPRVGGAQGLSSACYCGADRTKWCLSPLGYYYAACNGYYTSKCGC